METSCLFDIPFYHFSIPTSLPSTIDPALAITTFRSKRPLLLNLVRHCLSSLANSLLSESIISQDAYEKACNQSLGPTERTTALLDCVESRIEVIPASFSKVVHILERLDPFVEIAAKELVQSYCELL